MRRMFFGLGLLLLSSVALGGCGSDGDGDPQDSAAAGSHVGGSSSGGGEATGGSAGDRPAGTGGQSNGGAGGDSAGGQSAGGSAGELAAGAGGQVGEPGGPVELSGVTNARDTGGLTTADGQRVRDLVLIRSGHLGALDSTGCAQFEALGVHTVIDLRDAADAAQTPDAACVTSTAVYYNADLPRLLPPSEQVYLDTLDATEPVLAEIFSNLSAPDALAVIIHCVIGRDRASLVMALVLLALGVPEAQVLADFEHNQDASITVEPEWLSGVLQRIDQAGGIETYLGQHGVTSRQLEDLRAMALE